MCPFWPALFGGQHLRVIRVFVVLSFWLHAVGFSISINPQTLTQPILFTYLGIGCQIACGLLLAAGIVLLLRSGWLLLFHFREGAAVQRQG